MSELEKLKKIVAEMKPIVDYMKSKINTYDHSTGKYFIKCAKCNKYDNILESIRNRTHPKFLCNNCYNSKCWKCKGPATTRSECRRFPSCNRCKNNCTCRVCWD